MNNSTIMALLHTTNDGGQLFKIFIVSAIVMAVWMEFEVFGPWKSKRPKND